jgi:uncharacterized protein (TIGR02594 family)
MIKIPPPFNFLHNEPGPKMILEAIKHYGLREVIGKRDNPEIIQWAKELNSSYYTSDSIPWCGLFIAICAHRAGKEIPKEFLRALSWSTWGKADFPAELGSVLTFRRKGGGHVGMYVAEDSTHFYVLGGNQNDSVSVTRKPKFALVAARSSYRLRPANLRRIFVNAGGSITETRES